MLQRLVIRNRFVCSFWNILSFSSNESYHKLPLPLARFEEKNKTDTYSLCRSGIRCFSSSFVAHVKEERPLCSGCGVYMQSKHPKAPGFFLSSSHCKQKLWVDVEPNKNLEQVIFLDPDEDVRKFTNKNEQEGPEKPAVCARCHSLRNYSKVKDESVENLLPDFDFEATVGPRLMHTSSSRSTVLMVVDSVDFDGSFPGRAARFVSQAIEERASAWTEGKSGNVPRLVVVATKLDLLPTHLVTPQRLEKWVRQRSRIGGAAKLQGVHLVSAHKGWGIRNLAEHMEQLAGPRGNVWVIGAQNAGKSSLINAIGKHFGNTNNTQLTQAPVPGTTLGIIRAHGILLDKANLYDTPGILHPHQISTRLNRQEQKLIHITKELKPRTYRLKVGQSVHVGGLMRVDIKKASVETIYLTIWASLLIPLHLGKVENADMIKEQHFGLQLQAAVQALKDLNSLLRFHGGYSWNISDITIGADMKYKQFVGPL